MSAGTIVIDYDRLSEITGLSVPTIQRRVKDDRTFPPKIKLSKRRVGFLLSDVTTWLEAQKQPAI